jgi:ATP-dependent helicase HepA
MSEREPELGLGVVVSVDRSRIGIKFPASGEQRLYAVGTPVLKRIQFRVGETVRTRTGSTLQIESVEDEGGLLVYVGKSQRIREDEISDVTSVSSPRERFMAGQVDENEVFDLRARTLDARWKLLRSEVRGYLGGRLQLIPHQYYILHEVSSRHIPRVLLADEVGLGKTIEACLILQRLLAVGRAKRVLILIPESLTHQWFVELLRRFNTWYSIFDEERCTLLERTDPQGNPFLTSQLALASVEFLAQSEKRREQAIAAGWDVVVVDEAHHLRWSPDGVSPEYALVEALAQRTPGLLLLTATPTQLGLAGHFARLRLLDPNRYSDYDAFLEETKRYGEVAEVAERIVDEKPLRPADAATLKRIFTRDPKRLDQLLEAVSLNKPGARESLLKTLLDQHGTGRVVFRNTRAAMTGFPQRKFCPVPLSPTVPALLARVAREFEAEETGTSESIRYSFKDDPRIEWLAEFLREKKPEKALLICRSQRKVLAIESALKEKISANVALFHEGLPLVQRDRNAAWFAEPEGAQLLICSEIGSEGRNFQFAHHLILFDLPLSPGLIEQRIGRLDRIGQTQTIRIHVPYIKGSTDERVVEWYHHGLDAFETPLQAGNEYQERFRASLLELCADSGTDARFAALLAETAKFRQELSQVLHKGRDRLLELHSFDKRVAEEVLAKVRAADADPLVRARLTDLLDHFGVRIKEHEEGDVFLDPSHAYVESFPSIPAEGMLATFDRDRAIAREDIRFLSADHPLVTDAIDLLIDSPKGTASFGVISAEEPNLLVECVFVLEAVAESRWHVDQFLAPTPIRVLVDIRGNDLTDERDAKSLATEIEDGDIHRFLEKPGFNGAILKSIVEGATELAEKRTTEIRNDALRTAKTTLQTEIQRLVDLKKVNDHVRPEEIEAASQQLQRITDAILNARLRLDSLRVIVEGEVDDLKR